MSKNSTTHTTKTYVAALAHARKLAKEWGPCTVVREIVQRFPRLTRHETLLIAKAVGINAGTAGRQYQEVRSGNLRIAA